MSKAGEHNYISTAPIESCAAISGSTNEFSIILPGLELNKILADGAAAWGILQDVSNPSDGLIKITLSGKECLVDESLYSALESLKGHRVAVSHINGIWGIGKLGA